MHTTERGNSLPLHSHHHGAYHHNMLSLPKLKISIGKVGDGKLTPRIRHTTGKETELSLKIYNNISFHFNERHQVNKRKLKLMHLVCYDLPLMFVSAWICHKSSGAITYKVSVLCRCVGLLAVNRMRFLDLLSSANSSQSKHPQFFFTGHMIIFVYRPTVIVLETIRLLVPRR